MLSIQGVPPSERCNQLLDQLRQSSARLPERVKLPKDQIIAIANKPMNAPSPGCQRLDLQAANVLIGEITCSSDLNEAAEVIADFVARYDSKMEKNLVQIAADKLRNIAAPNAEGRYLAEDLTLELIWARIAAGEACNKLVEDYGLGRDEQIVLELMAVDSGAGDLLKEGASCLDICSKQGITTIEARSALLEKAADRATDEVKNRESYEVVGDICALTVKVLEDLNYNNVLAGPDAFTLRSKALNPLIHLQLAAVEGAAADHVKAGKSCLEVGNAYGISRDFPDKLARAYADVNHEPFVAISSEVELKAYERAKSLRYKARESIRQQAELPIKRLENKALRYIEANVKENQNCDQLAEDHGIRQKESRLKLELMMIERFAGDRLQRGESCDDLADKYRISHNSARLKIQMDAVNGVAGDLVRKGESWFDVAWKFRITEELPRSALEMLGNLVGENRPHDPKSEPH